MMNTHPDLPTYFCAKGIGVAHIICGVLWALLGTMLAIVACTVVVFTSSYSGPEGMITTRQTLLEAEPLASAIGIFIFAAVPTLLLIASGILILRGRGRGFVAMISWLACVFIPLGTILGVITLRSMSRLRQP